MNKKQKRGSSNELLRLAIKAGLRMSLGQVISQHRNRPLAIFIPKQTGYRTVTIRMNGKSRNFSVARIILWLKTGPPPDDSYQTDHINQNRLDDRIENLRWATPLENTLNVSEETRLRMKRACISGAKLSESQVRQIRRSKLRQCELVKRFKISPAQISNIVNRVTWKHVA